MKKKFILLFSFVLPVLAFCQQDWKRTRHAIDISIGSTNFLGDLGGKNSIGTNDFRDIDAESWSLGTQFGYSYALRKTLFLRGMVAMGRIKGSDANTLEDYRQNRNMSFRSNYGSLAVGIAYEQPFLYKDGNKYSIKGIRGSRDGAFYLGIYIGAGILFFNPKAEINGDWYALQPLRTEGQGLISGTEKYNRATVVYPFGLSLGKDLDARWKVSLEANWYFTDTDYLDDVSTTYVDPVVYQTGRFDADFQELATYFSNPSLGPGRGGLPESATSPGQQRGDPENDDTFFMLSVKVNYAFYSHKGRKPGKRIFKIEKKVRGR